jgi:2-dehydro-3-deoxyphosphogluconate aldolase/(4S)-4-hydroxy-2-oxoglutarate aldolase
MSAPSRVDARTALLGRIRHTGVIAVIRAESDDSAFRIAETLVGAGLRLIEITMTVPGAIGVMTALGRQFGSAIDLGAGTITSESMAEAAVEAGCAFLVTPCLVAGVIASAKARDVTIISGALTPTEILAADRAGADLVKIFPASTAGGPAYIRALRGPFPSIGFVATGGVGLDSVAEYIGAGVTAVGAGGELIARAAVKAGDFAAIGQAARAFLDAARQARPATEGVVR